MDESNLSLADYYNAIKLEHETNNAWSAEQAQKAMDYQTQMSNTAHQREVADLKAAGLNPILSAGGQGATTGSGIAAQRSDENVQALYGLVKEFMKANIAQANAMQNTAKYVSGASGKSNPVSADQSKLVKNGNVLVTDSGTGSSSVWTSKDDEKAIKAVSNVAAGKGYATDLAWALGKLGEVVGARMDPDVRARVANAPNSYLGAVTAHGVQKINEKSKVVNGYTPKVVIKDLKNKVYQSATGKKLARTK